MKHLIEEMTHPEFQERAAQDPVILIPLGSQETQGPSNPMGDFMLARLLARRVAEETGALVAPVLPFGFADCFQTVPGSVQLAPDTFRAVLRDMLLSFLNHGLRRLLVFNGHTGNTALIDLVLRDLRNERGVIIPWLNIWPLVPQSVRQAAHGADAPRAFGHGSDPIGSVYEHLLPSLTRRELARPEPLRRSLMGLPTAGLTGLRLDEITLNAPVRIADHCDLVVGGDPSLANAEAGRMFADYIVSATARVVRHLQSLPADCEG
ncbi:creatininase family protein [Chelatococcus asaccharovorans]|uniref:Creatinine amidohydrolase n=1 Tax=Chelatococcus asaccharovorans TaxID=28210 RepID=A0A2V3TZZ7_9HYPH|nr:creatininase family protein [Chelatococcus asaccharovorans]MBS7707753.1 creatininase family protein [Chelatococcus asaccharovorans]PXW55330.1 creatinine amidohydrolase [Chelatococcus asaccharovorans]